jgi:hypothetical protein
VFDDSLMLSLHVFLEGILFRHRAFGALSLTCPDGVSRFDIHAGEWEIQLPFKACVDNFYVFRRAVMMLVGYKISLNEPISPVMIAGWIRIVCGLIGFEVPTILYNL